MLLYDFMSMSMTMFMTMTMSMSMTINFKLYVLVLLFYSYGHNLFQIFWNIVDYLPNPTDWLTARNYYLKRAS